jgi:hypothetical protein
MPKNRYFRYSGYQLILCCKNTAIYIMKRYRMKKSIYFILKRVLNSSLNQLQGNYIHSSLSQIAFTSKFDFKAFISMRMHSLSF